MEMLIPMTAERDAQILNSRHLQQEGRAGVLEGASEVGKQILLPALEVLRTIASGVQRLGQRSERWRRESAPPRKVELSFHDACSLLRGHVK